jgi:hypothetical protein
MSSVNSGSASNWIDSIWAEDLRPESQPLPSVSEQDQKIKKIMKNMTDSFEQLKGLCVELDPSSRNILGGTVRVLKALPNTEATGLALLAPNPVPVADNQPQQMRAQELVHTIYTEAITLRQTFAEIQRELGALENLEIQLLVVQMESLASPKNPVIEQKKQRKTPYARGRRPKKPLLPNGKKVMDQFLVSILSQSKTETEVLRNLVEVGEQEPFTRFINSVSEVSGDDYLENISGLKKLFESGNNSPQDKTLRGIVLNYLTLLSVVGERYNLISPNLGIGKFLDIHKQLRIIKKNIPSVTDEIKREQIQNALDRQTVLVNTVSNCIRSLFSSERKHALRKILRKLPSQ